MSEHAKLSPSSASRWTICTGSVALEALYPNTSNKYADEGSAAHELAAICLLQDEDPGSYAHLESSFPNIIYDPGMIEYVRGYINFVKHLAKDKSLWIEEKLEFSSFIDTPKSFGTSDAVIIDGKNITIVDLKYGKGIKVDAFKNKQLMLYALGGLQEFPHTEQFKLIIYQPRIDHHMSEWDCSREELLEFAEHAKKAAHAINTNNVKFVPTKEGCRFCRAKKDCIALLSETAADDFDVLSAVIY